VAVAVAAVLAGLVAAAVAHTSGHVASGVSAANTTGAPGTVVVHWFGVHARGAAAKHWTLGAMRAATPPGVKGTSAPDGSPNGSGPSGTGPAGAGPLTSQPSPGNKVVGALFFTDGTGNHYCTASVITSANNNLLITAAHCMYSSGWKANIAFVPDYRNGKKPYGIWPVAKTTLYSNWLKSMDRNYDYAFLQVKPPKTQSLQLAVGAADTLQINAKPGTWVVVTGYPNTLSHAIYCLNRATLFSATQLKFRCAGFSTGTSGSPWDAAYNKRTGTGAVIGVTGGYQRGGKTSSVSYSVRLGLAAQVLYKQASQ
jgi:V8-like Glu-specific endopeptidase